jgi:hypothetical protein
MSLQTLIDRTKQSAFFSELRKVSSDPNRNVSAYEALEAARRLSQDPKDRVIRYAQHSAVPALLGPVIGGARRGTKHVVDTRSMKGMGRALKASRGEMAAEATGSGIFGGGLTLSHDVINAARDKDTVNDFKKQYQKKGR